MSVIWMIINFIFPKGKGERRAILKTSTPSSWVGGKEERERRREGSIKRREKTT